MPCKCGNYGSSEEKDIDIIKICWKSEGKEIVEQDFRKRVDLEITTKGFSDGDELKIEIRPQHFNPRDEKYIIEETIQVSGNKAELKDILIDMHWPIVAYAESEKHELDEKSAELTIKSSGCGYQYFQYKNSNKSIPILRVVEIDVYVVVTTNPDDYLNYRCRKNGDENDDIPRLAGYLEEGFNVRYKSNIFSKKDVKALDSQLKYREENDLPIQFNFNLIKYPVNQKATSKNQFLGLYHAEIETKRRKYECKGKYNCTYNRSVFAARLIENPGNNAGRAGAYGTGFITLTQGDKNTCSERADKSIVHEMIHAFYDYNSALVMHSSSSKHNDASLGGTGALSYSTNCQESINMTNLNKILETLPYGEDSFIN